jgi:hypothetical protein
MSSAMLFLSEHLAFFVWGVGIEEICWKWVIRTMEHEIEEEHERTKGKHWH